MGTRAGLAQSAAKAKLNGMGLDGVVLPGAGFDINLAYRAGIRLLRLDFWSAPRVRSILPMLHSSCGVVVLTTGCGPK